MALALQGPAFTPPPRGGRGRPQPCGELLAKARRMARGHGQAGSAPAITARPTGSPGSGAGLGAGLGGKRLSSTIRPWKKLQRRRACLLRKEGFLNIQKKCPGPRLCLVQQEQALRRRPVGHTATTAEAGQARGDTRHALHCCVFPIFHDRQ